MAKLREGIRQMRAQYESQKVPDELYRRLDALAAAPPSKKHKPMRWLRRFGGGCAAALMALCIAASTSGTAARALEEIPVLGKFVSLFKFHEYSDSKNGVELQLEGPHISGLPSSDADRRVNAQFDRYVEQIMSQYEADAAAAAGLDEGHESITTSYNVLIDNERQPSVAVNTTIVMAGAQNCTVFYNIDKQSGELVPLSALFDDGVDYITPISREIIGQMRAQMAADDQVCYWLDDEVEEWNFTAIDTEQQYYINAAGELVISFDKYSVAPGFMGSVTFTIPQAVTDPLVRAGGLLDQ